MKIAITGASGFLGRYLVEHLTGLGHEVRGLIRAESPRNASKLPIEWVFGSVSDPDAVRSLVDGAGALVHAAHDRPGGGFQEPGADVALNVEQNLVATVRLIEAAKTERVGRIVVISSGAVHDVILPDRPLDETHPLWPKSHYGATKAAIEAFVHSYGLGEGLPIAALRPTAIYGLADPITASRWYPLVAAVVRGEAVDCQRGAKLVHALDVARATALRLGANGIAGEVYHCTDQFIADHEVATLAQKYAGTHGTIRGDVPPSRNPIACSKLRHLGMAFGGQPLLETTIRQMVEAIKTQGSR